MVYAAPKVHSTWWCYGEVGRMLEWWGRDISRERVCLVVWRTMLRELMRKLVLSCCFFMSVD